MELNKPGKIVFIGGDLRQIRVVNQMAKSDMNINVFGFDENIINKFDESVEFVKNIEELNGEYKVINLPLPYTTDGENINAPFFSGLMPINEVITNILPKSYVLAGRCDEKIKTIAEICGITLVDYFQREELMMLNAVPTAEGALQIAMEETPHTLHGARCLVTGGGRISKILSKMLHGIGAKVSVSARKRGDLAQAEAFGYTGIPIWELYNCIDRFDVVFNTVPSLVMDSRLLSKIHKSCLIIDLASKPGGVDFDAAQKLGIKVIWALSLPGKVAPDTAGDIIASTILNILDEMEV